MCQHEVSAKDAAIECYWALKPIEFSETEGFELRYLVPTADELPRSDLTFVRRSGHSSDDPRLVPTFSTVAKLRLTDVGLLQLPLIEVFSIADRGWEQLKYSVHETEEDALEFYCETFEAHGRMGAWAHGRTEPADVTRSELSMSEKGTSDER
jgi:hypothetical protein